MQVGQRVGPRAEERIGLHDLAKAHGWFEGGCGQSPPVAAGGDAVNRLPAEPTHAAHAITICDHVAESSVTQYGKDAVSDAEPALRKNRTDIVGDGGQADDSACPGH